MNVRLVRRQPKDPGPAAWNAILPAAGAPRVLDKTVTCDWLVIGAGFAGLSAARRLGQLCPTDRIVVLDATRVGEGPAGRSSGFMIDLPHDLSSTDYSGGSAGADRIQMAMNRAAIAFAAEAASEYGLPSDVFTQCGKINAAATGRGGSLNARFASHLAAMGEPHETLDAAAMRRITGTDYYRSGLYTPGAAILQPAAYLRGLADELVEDMGIYENSPVVRFGRTGGIWRAGTPSGGVEAPRVILAVNGHIQSFGYFQRRLMHVFTYAAMTRALTGDEVGRLGGEPSWGVLPADPMGTTVRRISGTGGDRIVVRSRFTCEPGMKISDAQLDKTGGRLERAFVNRFPMLAGVEMEYRWAGRLCLSWNGVPAFGEIDDGLYSACCQNGLGVARGTFSGIMAAELATGHNPPLLADLLAADEPRRLPPEPLAWLGANATLRWKEWQAGAEV